jgi:hypothetical protein
LPLPALTLSPPPLSLAKSVEKPLQSPSASYWIYYCISFI